LIDCKGVDCLIRAVARLKAMGISAHCSIAGRGDELAQLEALAASLEVADRVVFTGGLQPEAVVQLLRQSDVLVLPSRRTKVWEEQFGRVLVEAMAQATVTVGSRTGAIPEVIDCEGLLFAEGDSEGLADILIRLATDVVFLQAQQHRLWERARDCYLHESLARRRVAFLRSVLSSTA
jgi:glycosyltransferase involved in cell wall biosynthesis